MRSQRIRYSAVVLPLGTLDRVALAVIMTAEIGLGVWLIRRARRGTFVA